MNYFSRHKIRKAVVLIGVLWLVMLMTVIITVLAQTSMLDARVRQAGAEQMLCKWTCRAGLETAVVLLNEDEKDSDSLADIWSDYPEMTTDVALADCKFTIEVIDEAGKLNINTATAEQLYYIPDMTEDIVDSILDWRDSDDEPRTGGAESGYYMNVSAGYECRNGEFKTIRELLLVKGVTESLLYGDTEDEYVSDYNEGWINYLTCCSYDSNKDGDGNARININTAEEQVLREQLGLKPSHAKWIVDNREFDSLGDLLGGGTQNNQQNNAQQNSNTGTNANTTANINITNQQSTGQQNSGRQQGQNQNQQNQNQSPQVQAEALDIETFYNILDKITVNNDQKIAGRVNINTASYYVLIAFLEGDEQVAEDIISYRQGLSEGIVSLSELKDIGSITQDIARRFIDSVTTRSNVYTVKCTATADATGAVRKQEAVVDRGSQPVEILYFCDGVGR